MNIIPVGDLGIRSMASRAERLGGELRLLPGTLQGTRVRVIAMMLDVILPRVSSDVAAEISSVPPLPAPRSRHG
jgi:hypothetical protein